MGPSPARKNKFGDSRSTMGAFGPPILFNLKSAGPMTTTGQPHSHSTRRQAAFIFVFITVVLDMIALGVTVPVLPKLILDFNSGNVPEAVQVNAYFAALWAFM